MKKNIYDTFVVTAVVGVDKHNDPIVSKNVILQNLYNDCEEYQAIDCFLVKKELVKILNKEYEIYRELVTEKKLFVKKKYYNIEITEDCISSDDMPITWIEIGTIDEIFQSSTDIRDFNGVFTTKIFERLSNLKYKALNYYLEKKNEYVSKKIKK